MRFFGLYRPVLRFALFRTLDILKAPFSAPRVRFRRLEPVDAVFVFEV